METLIPVINQLQDVLNAVGSDEIDLPQIVVVGSQSSGKSSVLESLVGRDFLPRGSGIVTRRPLVLQLHNIPPSHLGDANAKGSSSGGAAPSAEKEWGVFNHLKTTFSNFNDIRDEIQRETDRVAGKNKGVISQPITLKIYSPHVLNLTLVDLPGITKVPVGDQPSNIEEQIRDMVMSFISKPSAIILAVTAANTDLANSDALQMAKRVDPQGDRTIGVLTKLDLMDKGTNAMEVLQGNLVPLKLGYIAVMNRSQQDIITEKPMKEALKAEEEFFAAHPQYKNLEGQCGTRFLAKSLNKTLMYHIKAKIPELRSKVSKSLEDAVKELHSFGTLPTGANKHALILELITKFHTGYKECISGKVSKDESRVVTELTGGARINFVFQEIFTPALLRINPLEGLTSKEICFAIRNATGPRNALFIPESAFELLVKRQIARLEYPALQCIDHVFSELQRIVVSLENAELSRFERLRERVMSVAEAYLHKCRAPCKQMITDLLAIESAYINTSHPDFLDAIQKVRAKNDKQQLAGPASSASSKRHAGKFDSSVVSSSSSSQGAAASKPPTMSQLMASAKFGDGPLTEREQNEVDMVKQLLESYFAIVRTNIQDTIPKAIMHLLVHESTKVDKELILHLLTEGDHNELLMESDECATRRKTCEGNVEMLQKAKEILSTVNHAVA